MNQIIEDIAKAWNKAQSAKNNEFDDSIKDSNSNSPENKIRVINEVQGMFSTADYECNQLKMSIRKSIHNK